MAVKKRNPLFVIVVSFLTFFIYALYWFYATRSELNELTGNKTSALLWTLGLFVPLLNLYVIWRYCEDVEIASKKARDKVVLFIAWLVFIPLAQYLVQEELNKFAK
ncbi:MAG TPA: DUF4234 domain-containing protein [Candidatus Bilamarchaeum sp.]|nr:DUF4234 domain-containing protein [Candidatus Bilamarchaeum sp.]